MKSQPKKQDDAEKGKARELLRQWAGDRCLVGLCTGPIVVVGRLGDLEADLGPEIGNRFSFSTYSQEIQATFSLAGWEVSVDSDVDPPVLRFRCESEQGFTLSRQRRTPSMSDAITRAKECLVTWAKSNIPLSVRHQSSFVSVISRCEAVHVAESTFQLIGLDSHQAYLIDLLDCETLTVEHSAAGTTLLLMGFTGDSRLKIGESNASIAEEISNLISSD